MSDKWWFQVLGQEFGPFSFEQLIEYAQKHEFDRSDLVRSGDREGWVAASNIDDLFSETTFRRSHDSGQSSQNDESPATPQSLTVATAEHTAEPPETQSTADWYCDLNGRIMGPVPTETIAELVHKNLLSSKDRVRVGQTGEWLPASTVVSLFQENEAASLTVLAGTAPSQSGRTSSLSQQVQQAEAERPEAPSVLPSEQDDKSEINAAAGSKDAEGTSSAAREVLDELNRPSHLAARLAQQPTAQRLQLTDALQSGWRFVTRCGEGVLGLLASSAAILQSKIILAVLSIILVLLVARHVPLPQFNQPDPHEKLTGIWSDIKDLRDRDASDAEWGAFAAKSQTELAPLIINLEQSVGPSHPEAMLLLQAGRDYMPLILSGARESPNEAENEFATRLQYAELLAKENKPLFDTTTLIYATFFIIDGIIAIWLIYMAVRSWKRK